MKKIKLNAEEIKISQAIEREEFVAVTGQQLEEMANAIASRKKDASLTIRVNSNDINRIKKMAQKKGIPYQSYIAEVIHQVAESLP
jgi:predicted DNA binding CopG/RHH family protein